MSVSQYHLRPDGVAGRDFISWSQLSTFRQCPLRYHFRYVEKLPEEIVSASLLFGGAFHAAIEHHHRIVFEGSEPPSVDELLDYFWHEWNLRGDDVEAIKFGKGDDLNSIGELADRMLVAFQQSELVNVEGDVIGIEEELREAVIPGCPELLARIDLIIDRGNDLVLRDYKTARSRWSQATAESSAEQLLLYGELVGRLSPAKKLRLEYIVVTKTKTPAVELYQIGASPERVAKTTRVAQLVFRAIEDGVVFPNPSPMNCSSCPFQSACVAWKG